MTEQLAASIVLWTLGLHFFAGFVTAVVLIYSSWYQGMAVRFEDLGYGLLVTIAGVIMPIRMGWMILREKIADDDKPIGQVVLFKGRQSARVFNHLKNSD